MPTKTIARNPAPLRAPSKPFLTWAAVGLLPLVILPFTAMAHGADPSGPVGELATFAVIAVPPVGLILLIGARQRRERGRMLRGILILLYGLATVGMVVLTLLGMLFGPGDNW